jgi:Domain of unknown function (DUF1995)
MIRQAASAMNRAANDGHSRQIVRVLLPRDATNADFGIYAEGEGTDNVNMVLCPTDESWQGGIMQLYRAAAPTTERLIRQLSTLKSTASGAAGVAPRISEDRSVDESGVDGVGLFTTSDKSIQCYVQPTQELVDDVIMDSLPSSSTMTIMLNPQWRQVDDALDTASKGEGFLSGLANMLGGKGGTLKRIKDAGFVPVYSLEGYVCRGANVRLLQVYDGTTGAFNAPWSVFCERDDGESYVAVGTSAQRPTYQDVERMLNEADIGYKYARDMGMQPKL